VSGNYPADATPEWLALVKEQDDPDRNLAVALARHGKSTCQCGRIIDRGDVAWNSGSTEAGTEYSVIWIICQACDTEIAQVHSWMPWIDTFEEAVHELMDSSIEWQ
jgi:hypothetical protein